MQIGTAVKTIRKNKKIKQRELSAFCEISQTYLSQIENNKRSINSNLIEKFSKALNVPIPVIMFLSLKEEDVKNEKKELFNHLNTTINRFIEDIFINE